MTRPNDPTIRYGRLAGNISLSSKLSGRAVNHDHSMGALRFAIEINIVKDHPQRHSKYWLVAARVVSWAICTWGCLCCRVHDRSSHLSMLPSTLTPILGANPNLRTVEAVFIIRFSLASTTRASPFYYVRPMLMGNQVALTRCLALLWRAIGKQKSVNEKCVSIWIWPFFLEGFTILSLKNYYMTLCVTLKRET